MKKKLIFMFICLLTILCAIGLVSCGGGGEDDNGGGDTPPKHEHTYIHHSPTDATCGMDGNVEYWSCSGCNKLFSDNQGTEMVGTVVIPATNDHTFSEWTISKQATCTQSGIKERQCSVCLKKETIIIDALGHTFTDWNFDSTYHWHECIVCNETLDKAEHNWVNEECTICHYVIATEGLSYTLNSDKKSYTLSGIGSSDATDIRIPSTYNGFPITRIGSEAFANDIGLKSIIISSSVISIDESAFQNCSKLTRYFW